MFYNEESKEINILTLGSFLNNQQPYMSIKGDSVLNKLKEELINKKNVDYIYDFLEVDVPKKKIDFSKENESFGLDIEISNKTIQELTKKYHSYNIALANKFNLEVSYWLGMK